MRIKREDRFLGVSLGPRGIKYGRGGDDGACGHCHRDFEACSAHADRRAGRPNLRAPAPGHDVRGYAAGG